MSRGQTVSADANWSARECKREVKLAIASGGHSKKFDQLFATRAGAK